MVSTRPPRVGIIIPARYGSSRFPGKPLVKLRGPGGVARSLVEHSWMAASNVAGVDSLCVATDDRRIAEEVTRFGGRAVMTPAECANGTERCAAAVAGWDDAPEVIVNFQGDAPLTPTYLVEDVLARMGAEPGLPVATSAIRCTPSLYRHLVDDQNAGRVGGTTVVFDAAGHALYFSKRVIPYLPGEQAEARSAAVHLHVGVYAYRRKALETYAATPPTDLEQLEELEQLRFLVAGVKVAVVVCQAPGWDVIELNNPSDVAPIEAALQRRQTR